MNYLLFNEFLLTKESAFLNGFVFFTLFKK